MMLAEIEKLKGLIVNLKESEALSLVKELLNKGASPAELLLVVRDSLQEVGKLYEDGEFYIIGLVLAGELMLQAMAILMPALKKDQPSSSRGLVILGTIEGDIHDLGKRQTAFLLAANGFEVLDLGVDVSMTDFWVQAILKKPILIGVSVMMRGCLASVKRMIGQLHTAHKEMNRPPIFVSGVAANPDNYKLTGADYYVTEAFQALELALKISNQKAEAVKV